MKQGPHRLETHNKVSLSRRTTLLRSGVACFAALLPPAPAAASSTAIDRSERTRGDSRSAIEIPGPGHARNIARTGAHQDVRPAPLTPDNWNYALFGSFGSGTYNRYYSPLGAFVLACSGGHGHPHFFGAAVFDFDSASWSYLPCSNPGLAEQGGNNAVAEARTNGAPYWEMLGITQGQVPSPPHPYKCQVVLPPEHGGGAKGSMLHVTRCSVRSAGSMDAGTVHAFDLVTGMWTRISADDSVRKISPEGQIVFDPVAVRYYALVQNQHNYDYLLYWNPATTRFEQGPKQAVTINDNTRGGPYSVSGFIHENSGVRALVFCRRDPLKDVNYTLAGIDLDNQAAGWIRRLSIVGDPIEGDHANWTYHQAQGVYYRRPKRNMGQTLHRLVPPAGSPLTGTWTHGTVTLQGDSIPEFIGQPLTQSGGYKSLMYIPALQMLGWVTPSGVTLLNP